MTIDVMKSKEYQYDISVMRIIATLAVLLMHESSIICDQPQGYSLTDGQYSILHMIHMSMFWAVPLFLMITGALLLEKDRDISPKTCLNKYAKRIVLVLIVFGIPLSILQQFIDNGTLSTHLIIKALKLWSEGNAIRHFWYLYTLLGIYLILPMIGVFYHQANRSTILYIILVLVTMDFILPTVGAVVGVNFGFLIPVTYVITYLLLGRYLRDDSNRLGQSRTICIGATILMLLVEVVLSIEFPGLSASLINYKSPVILLHTIMIFGALQGIHCPEKSKILLHRMDRLCFGVYLIHPFPMHLLYKKFHLTPMSFENVVFGCMVLFILFTMVSFIISWLMSRIKKKKRIM